MFKWSLDGILSAEPGETIHSGIFHAGDFSWQLRAIPYLAGGLRRWGGRHARSNYCTSSAATADDDGIDKSDDGGRLALYLRFCGGISAASSRHSTPSAGGGSSNPSASSSIDDAPFDDEGSLITGVRVGRFRLQVLHPTDGDLSVGADFSAAEFTPRFRSRGGSICTFGLLRRQGFIVGAAAGGALTVAVVIPTHSITSDALGGRLDDPAAGIKLPPNQAAAILTSAYGDASYADVNVVVLGAFRSLQDSSSNSQRCERTVFPCHRVVLAASSAPLAAALAAPMQEALHRAIVIQEADPATVELMLRFMYGGLPAGIKLSLRQAVQLWALAHRFMVAPLCAALCEALRTRVRGKPRAAVELFLLARSAVPDSDLTKALWAAFVSRPRHVVSVLLTPTGAKLSGSDVCAATRRAARSIMKSGTGTGSSNRSCGVAPDALLFAVSWWMKTAADSRADEQQRHTVLEAGVPSSDADLKQAWLPAILRAMRRRSLQCVPRRALERLASQCSQATPELAASKMAVQRLVIAALAREFKPAVDSDIIRAE